MMLHCCAALYWGLELVSLDDESLSRYREQQAQVTEEIESTLLDALVANSSNTVRDQGTDEICERFTQKPHFFCSRDRDMLCS
ncbi:hypothetical protein K505DRAFT_106922 [Melanomma pulvis-pyrius CBS 109.77]|uniref:Uncharacterized protein n=1 Tax=Melanomma pulvis-pyrius CBS 109.77 TaxID=1314802 RepID=A0A6A6XQL7_9PLEO|nr:hypothetical protein K505DRAFT_106922 [Melanomma pulvis-pyrius CBS 109.77]